MSQDTEAERSWPEDAPLENGNYSNTCIWCKAHFIGHKRRPVCRVCATPKSVRAEVDSLRLALASARTAAEQAQRDAKRLDWLETQEGMGLISDDAGHWSVSGCGMQNVPDNPPQDIQTTFFIEREEWKDSVRAAIDAAMSAQCFTSATQGGEKEGK